MLLNCGVGEDSWESLGLQRDQTNQSTLKEISPEYSLEGLMLKPILWPPDLKNWLTGKDSDTGKDWRQEEKGTSGDEMVRWHHWLNGHEFEQAPGVGDGQGSLACCSPWGHKELDMTERLNWTDGPSVIERHQEPKVRRKERTTEGWTWQGAAVPKTSSESESYSVVSNILWSHGYLQATILEWVVIPFSRGSSQPRNRTGVSCTADGLPLPSSKFCVFNPCCYAWLYPWGFSQVLWSLGFWVNAQRIWFSFGLI